MLWQIIEEEERYTHDFVIGNGIHLSIDNSITFDNVYGNRYRIVYEIVPHIIYSNSFDISYVLAKSLAMTIL